ncbi:ABC transporter permease [Nocardioides sp. W3-2-3]|uniref:ABC transporter permease n=1 Tax=Nocardioides convexus TaxID=2712224 RepID=UPI0024188FE9|nr:ABC transporter permease [Nocardioides convexus]NHA01057.1 ABC transporter permease [Nocardioides convexus]
MIRDTRTLLRRNLLHMVRYPSLTIMLVAQPVLFLLLFVYVFGGTLGAGLPGGGDRDAYLTYLAPAILLVTVASVAMSIAIYAAKDATEGIVDRLRTMPIAHSSVLTGLVLAALVQTALALAVVLGIAVALGYRPDAGPLGWLGALGVLGLLAFALTWLCVGLGLAADSVETASNTPMFLVLLPFVSSAFVPTDSMPRVLAWIAEHQPFTPVIDTLRALLDGADPGSDLGWAIGWCVLITALCFAWSVRLFGRAAAR